MLFQAQVVVDALEKRPTPPVKNKPDMSARVTQMMSHFRTMIAQDTGGFFALPTAAVPSLKGARTTRMALSSSTLPSSCLPSQTQQSAIGCSFWFIY